MASTSISRKAAPSTPIESLPPTLAWAGAFVEGLLQLQQFQLEALTSWQRSFSAVQQELWDEWVAHWGGGVPLEG